MSNTVYKLTISKLFPVTDLLSLDNIEKVMNTNTIILIVTDYWPLASVTRIYTI